MQIGHRAWGLLDDESLLKCCWPVPNEQIQARKQFARVPDISALGDGSTPAYPAACIEKGIRGPYGFHSPIELNTASGWVGKQRARCTTGLLDSNGALKWLENKVAQVIQ